MSTCVIGGLQFQQEVIFGVRIETVETSTPSPSNAKGSVGSGALLVALPMFKYGHYNTGVAHAG